jgi:hypothetical protein
MDASWAATQSAEYLLMPTPIFCEPTCVLDSILINFLASQRQLVAMNLHDQAVGPSAPNLPRALDLTHSWPTHALSRLIDDILARFDEVNQVPEKTAVHWTFHQLLRVWTSPTLMHPRRN